MLGIFSSRGLSVELFSICYWQVSGSVEASAVKQTGESAHSLTADPFLFLSLALSLPSYSSLAPDTSHPYSCPSSFCFFHFLLAAVRLQPSAPVLCAALHTILSLTFICCVAIAPLICPVAFSIITRSTVT